MHDERRRSPFVKHLVSENDPNIYDANNDYSGVGNAVDFILKPPDTETYQVDLLTIQILDTNMTMTKYGGITTPPGFIGIEIGAKDKDGNILFRLSTIEEKITTNAELIAVLGDNANPFQSFGFGDDLLIVNHRFHEKDMDFILDGRKGEYLFITLNDDFSALSKQQFHAQGRIVSKEFNRNGWINGRP